MKVNKIREQKQQRVVEITEMFKGSTSTVIADYRGLTVAQITDLRKQLREVGIEFSVLKNSLVRRAAANVELSELDAYLVGPTAIAFSPIDPVAPAKILVDFSKKHNALQLKAGVIEGKIVELDQLKELAALPSRDGLLSMLLSVLQAPMRNVALAVKAVSEQQESNAQ